MLQISCAGACCPGLSPAFRRNSLLKMCAAAENRKKH